jgi:hypothetical protein
LRRSSSIACSAALLAALLAALAGCRAQPLRLHDQWPAPVNASPAPAEPKAPWLALDAPSDGASLVAVVPLVEVRGHAGLGLHGPQDVVLTLDSSGSVFTASGIDLDGDGITGIDRCDLATNSCDARYLEHWTTDFDDVLIKVELDAARHLIAQLDPNTTRMGIVTFGGDASIEVSVGPLAAASAELADFGFGLNRGSDIVGGLHASLDALEQAPQPPDGAPPQRSILLLTDGEVAIPELDFAAQDEYLNGFLARARAAHTRVFTFGVGPQGPRASKFMTTFASETGGRYASMKTAGDIAVELQLVRLTGLADVELHNTTTGGPGRAVRVFPNGSFDGYAPLVPGDNDLAVTATFDDGRRVESHARVHFESPAHPTEAQLADAEKLAANLRDRTVSTDLAVRVEAERRRRAHELTVKPEATPPKPP